MALVSVKDYEEKAKTTLAKSTYEFYSCGAFEEQSSKRNRTAFQNIFLRPRVLRDVSVPSMTCNIFGDDVGIPIGVAPTAFQKLAHSSGEIGTAKAAGKHKTVYIMSVMSSISIEDLSAAVPDTIKWLQIFPNERISANLMKKAEALNFKAFVITTDLPVSGIRYPVMRQGFTLPDHIGVTNFPEMIESHVKKEGEFKIARFIKDLIDPSVTWENVKNMIQLTKLPVILKGILTVEDALIAAEIGCKGIIVSNHGGRQLDGVLSTIEILPEIVRAVGDKLVVMMDGGITNGLDVYKALALGAKMVFIGRSVLWGLAADGEKGVENVFSILKRELSVGMALCGTPKIDLITKEYLISQTENSKL